MRGSGLPPATAPEVVPAAKVRAVGQPVVTEAHAVDGELAVIAPPIVLANGTGEFDPKNPARAAVQGAALSRDKARADAQTRLDDLLRKGPGHPDYNADEVHRLHYAAAGQDVPAA